MSDPDRKHSSIAALARNLGREVTHTRDDGNSAEDALDAEADLFAGATVPSRKATGRPKGAPNRSTAELARWLRQRGYRDPVEFLHAVMSADPRELAASLAGHGDASRVDFDRALEVLKIQVKAAGEAAGYVHRRMPLQVDIREDDARPLVVIVDGAAGPSRRTIEASVLSIDDDEQDQALSMDAAIASDGDRRTQSE